MRFTRMFRACICVLLVALLLGSLPILAEEPQAKPPLLLQTGRSLAFENGRLYGINASPQYASNGAVLVPLRLIAERLGGAVSWDGLTKQTVLTVGDTVLIFASGSWNCFVGGQSRMLPSPATIIGETFFIPLLALEWIPGIYIQAYGYYEGAYLVIADTAKTAKSTESFNAALAAFGPNEGLFDRTTVQLRLGSRFALAGGKETQLCQRGGSLVPYRATDGMAMIPTAFCAKALGVNPADCSTIPVTTKDGVGYSALKDFTAALGLYGYEDQNGGILISPWELSERQDLQTRAWERVSQWPLKDDEDVKGYIALTFDDGPSGSISARLLDGLKTRGAHATFFLCSYRMGTFPQTLPRYLAEGHEVGSHSANHTILTGCSSDTLAWELDQANAAIMKQVGIQPQLMRPPGGGYNQAVLSALASRDMRCIMWSVDPQDWKYHNKDTVVHNILSKVQDGDIVLLHDMYDSSIDAALSVIDTLQAQGYRFVTVSELARIKGVTLKPGAVYAQIR